MSDIAATTTDHAPSTDVAVLPDDRVSIAKLARLSGWLPEKVAEGNLLINQHYIRDISDLHVVKLEMLTVAVPPQGSWESEDLYTMQGKLAPTKHLLERMSHAAGVQWDVGACRFDLLHPENVIFTAVGGIRGPSGLMTWKSATKEWSKDVEVMEIEERAATRSIGYGANARPMTDEERAAYIRSETARSIKNRLTMTESKAKTRVMRALLGIRGAADRAYWSKPFFIPRIDVVLDANDPEIRGRVFDDAFNGRQVLGYSQQRPVEHITDVDVVGEEA